MRVWCIAVLMYPPECSPAFIPLGSQLLVGYNGYSNEALNKGGYVYITYAYVLYDNT